jgi:hypothetical protein
MLRDIDTYLGVTRLRRAVTLAILSSCIAATASSGDVGGQTTWSDYLGRANSAQFGAHADQQLSCEPVAASLVLSRWKQRFSICLSWPRGGVVVTAGGLILVGTKSDCKLRAYDKESGKEIWARELLPGREGIPSVFEVAGRDYVVISARPATALGGSEGRVPGTPTTQLRISRRLRATTSSRYRRA